MLHVLLRESADNLNISTLDFLKNNNRDELIKESGIIAEVTHFGGRIDWVELEFGNPLNTPIPRMKMAFWNGIRNGYYFLEFV